MRTRLGIALACLFAATAAWPQTGASCPGGRAISGFQLTAGTQGDAPLPVNILNNLAPGDTLQYAPDPQPAHTGGPARIALVLVPNVNDPTSRLRVYTQPADKPAQWLVLAPVGAVAFLYGPQGLDARKTGTLLQAHPELVSRFIEYATQTSRVEALVALLARYEASPPGSLDLNDLLKDYSAQYGIKMPTVNPALSPDEEAATLLAAVAPPSAQSAPSPHAALEAGSTSTAASIASLYFGPEVGLAYDTVPLAQALHQSLFPGTQFSGAFVQPQPGGGLSLCIATGAVPQKHPVYIWMVSVPGGAPPAVRLAKQAASVTVAEGWKTPVAVTAASVAELQELPRARAWILVSGSHAVTVPVEISVGAVTDTLNLDLTQAKLSPGTYRLEARWDWTPVTVGGNIEVRAIPSLAKLALTPRSEDTLVTGQATVPVEMTGPDFAFVNKIDLVSAAGGDTTPQTLKFTPPAGPDTTHLTVNLDTSKLVPGAYDLRLTQVDGKTQTVPLTIHPANPTLDQLPLRANLGETSQTLTLHGAHLQLIDRITSPDAAWTLAPADAGADLSERGATVTLTSHAKRSQVLPMRVFVSGLPDPMVVDDALEVLGPRPAIRNVTQAPSDGGEVALRPGELSADAIVNFTFLVAPADVVPTLQLRCQQDSGDHSPLTLHPGVPTGAQELDAGGGGLYYLALTPGQVGDPGCQLQMSVLDPDTGDSNPYDLGQVVRLPQITRFTLSNQSPAPGEFAGELTGQNLQLIAETGWSADTGMPVTSIPQRVEGTPPAQTLAIVMPWPPPSPHAPLYIWLRGETQGRKTTVTP